jgi:hypothetical protein
MTKKIVTCVISLCFLLTIFPRAAFPRGVFATVAEDDEEYEFSFSEAKLIIAKPTKKEGTPADEVINGAESLKHSIISPSTTRPPTPLPNVNVDPIEPPLPTSNHTPTECTVLVDPNPPSVHEIHRTLIEPAARRIKMKTDTYHPSLTQLKVDRYFESLSEEELKIVQPIVNKFSERNGKSWSEWGMKQLLKKVKSKIGDYKIIKLLEEQLEEQKEEIKELKEENGRRKMEGVKRQEQINKLQDERREEKEKGAYKWAAKCGLAVGGEVFSVIGKQFVSNWFNPEHIKDIFSWFTFSTAGIGIGAKVVSIALENCPIAALATLGVEFSSIVIALLLK